MFGKVGKNKFVRKMMFSSTWFYGHLNYGFDNTGFDLSLKVRERFLKTFRTTISPKNVLVDT